MKIWTISGLLLVLLVSCSTAKEFEYRDIKHIKLNSLGFDKTNLDFELVYYNPNRFGLDLRTVDADVYVDNYYLGKFNLDTTMHIAKKTEFNLPSKIGIDMKGIYKNAMNLVVSNEVLVSVKGTTKVGRFGIFKTIPFTYEGRHKLKLF